ncbi:MAG: GNAT family N-acetyltransferase [Verrucomicrobiales bacterium]|nr:GNAT family N-acetyltransferase [Verrucomicrobiales bacterium]
MAGVPTRSGTDSPTPVPPQGSRGGAGTICIEDPLSVADWDDRLARIPEATIFHTAAWARVLIDTYGFPPLYLTQRHEGRLLGLLPMMRTGSRWLGYRHVSLPFTDGCPPLLPPKDEHSCPSPAKQPAAEASITLDTMADRHPLLAAALSDARTRRSRFLELRDCEPWTCGVAPSVVFHGHAVPLLDSAESQLQQCSPAMRRALRKGDRSPLRLKESRELADVEAYFELHCQTRQRHGLPPQPFAFFRNLQRHLLHPGLGFVILALLESRPVAGAIFLGFGRTALYKFGASSESHLDLRPNNLVLWHGIRRCAELGFATLDLGRTSLDNSGLRRFKLGLGGEERLIHYVRQDVRAGRVIATPDRAHGWHNRVFRCLPRPLARTLGVVLYRFVA